MRPSDLNPLFADASSLRGVGPKVAATLDRLLAGPGRPARVLDLLFHLPTGTIDRRARPKIRDAPRDEVATLEVRVVSHHPATNPRSKAPYKVIVEDDTGDVTLVFFLANPAWVEKALPLNSTRWVSGKLELWDGRLQMVHPDRVLDAEGLAGMPAVEPVYPLTEGLYPRVLAKAIESALERCPVLPEWHDGDHDGAARLDRLRGRPRRRAPSGKPVGDRSRRVRPGPVSRSTNSWPANWRWRSCGTGCGFPAGGLTRATVASRPASRPPSRSASRRRSATPSPRSGPTSAAPQRMLRLLQGDVGSGKTIVALLAAADGGRSRIAGGPDGPDRDPGPPAPRPHRAACGRGRAAGSRS